VSKVEVASDVTGNVWKIETKVGDHVNEEDVLMIMESMKMEIPIEAECAGIVTEILVKEEDAVEEDQIVAIIESDG
jgi:acetyl-CoA carboxylase biotin carboxyl carrier protein